MGESAPVDVTVKSGSHPDSGSVAGLPSSSVVSIAVIGRQLAYVYLAVQHTIATSSIVLFRRANRRALSENVTCRRIDTCAAMRFQYAGVLPFQKNATSA